MTGLRVSTTIMVNFLKTAALHGNGQWRCR
jgi:hypothetical protein